jgi:LAO/AO transport system kinase
MTGRPARDGKGKAQAAARAKAAGPARAGMAARKGTSGRSLGEGIAAGDRRALARAITLIESTRAQDRSAADTLIESLLPRTGRAVRIGISGAPGVGKSSLIETLGVDLLARGNRLAVLAVDPTSPVSGGSILGDKTRMERLTREVGAFIRPSPSGGRAGGVARRTREAMLMCEAAGFDVVIVETVGVGQTEIAIRDLVDVVVLVLSPGGGDDLQGIKRGIMELADVILVNKADGDLAPAAERARGHVQAALRLLRPQAAKDGRPPVIACSAYEGTNIAKALDAMLDCHAADRASGQMALRRREQARAWLWAEIGDLLRAELDRDPAARQTARDEEAAVLADRTTPARAAARILQSFLGRASAK